MGGPEAAEDVEPSTNKQTECDTHLEAGPDFESFCRKGGIFVFKKRKKEKIPRDA